MPAPTNISAATATVIASLPASISQDVNFGGTTYTVWYVYIPTADGMVSIWGFGDLVTYKPELTIFSPDGVTQFATAASINKAIQFYGISGQAFYFRFVSSTGNVGAAMLLIEGAAFSATTTIPSGSIAVNDDTVGLPLALLGVADALPLNYVNPFPAGEHADILTSGIVAVEDISQIASDNSRVGLFDSSLSEIITYSRNMPDSGVTSTLIGSNTTSTFYVGWPADYDTSPSDGFPSFVTLSDAGVAGTIYALEGEWMFGLAPSNDETILYYCGQVSGTYPVKRWDLVNHVGLSDLAADIGSSYQAVGILVLADDSIVVLYHDPGGSTDDLVKIYAADGTLLHTHTYAAPDVQDTRLASDPAYTSYWIWTKGTGIDSRFRKITPATGAATVDVTGSLFEKGVYRGASTATPAVFFGESESCPFWITRAGITPPPTNPPVITGIVNTNTGASGMACARTAPQRITLTGTGFQDGLSVTGTDPLGNALTITIEVVTDVGIELSFATVEYGQFCFIVTNPDGFVSSQFCIQSTSCTEPVTMRRLRRGAHIKSEKHWLFHKSFTLDYEAGVGLTDGLGSDPELLLRWSDDGGHEWSGWHAVKIGKIGRYKARAIWRRLGRSRDRIYELVCSEPIKTVWLNAYLEAEEGTS